MASPTGWGASSAAFIAVIGDLNLKSDHQGRTLPSVVMPGLVPGIHVIVADDWKDMDGRDEPGHDRNELMGISTLHPSCALRTISFVHYVGGESRKT